MNDADNLFIKVRTMTSKIRKEVRQTAFRNKQIAQVHILLKAKSDLQLKRSLAVSLKHPRNGGLYEMVPDDICNAPSC